MSTAAIAIAVLFGIIIMFSLFYVGSSIEKKRSEKAQLISNLRSRINLLDSMLDEAPDGFVPEGLRQAILREIQKRYQKLTEVDPQKSMYRVQLESVTESLNQGAFEQSSVQRFASLDESNKVRSSLQKLSRLIDSFARSKVLPLPVAKSYLTEMKSAFSKAQGNFIADQAELTYEKGKLQNAVQLFQRAITEFEKSNAEGQHQPYIEELNQRIEKIRAEQKEKTAAAAADSELTKGVNSMESEEDDTWKKKKYY